MIEFNEFYFAQGRSFRKKLAINKVFDIYKQTAAKRYYDENKEKEKERSKRYYDKNKEKIKSVRIACRLINKKEEEK